MPKFDLTDRVAVVTGGSQGIGRGIALALAEHGADVAIVARAPEAVAGGTERIHRPVDPVVQEIEAMGRRALGVLADIRDPEQVQGMAAQVTGAFGRVDILVNNAGATWGETFKMAPLLELTPRDFQECLRLNLMSQFLCSCAIAPGMVERGEGRHHQPGVDLRAGAEPRQRRIRRGESGRALAHADDGRRVGARARERHRARQRGPRRPRGRPPVRPGPGAGRAGYRAGARGHGGGHRRRGVVSCIG